MTEDRFSDPPAPTEDFEDLVQDGQAFVPQAEECARKSNIPLDEGWKLDFAKQVKIAILRAKGDALQDEPKYLEIWRNIFTIRRDGDSCRGIHAKGRPNRRPPISRPWEGRATYARLKPSRADNQSPLFS